MTQPIEDLHVYLRSIRDGERTSLSVLASLVTPHSTVLDLGCGSGALGQHLAETRHCTSDGVTLSEAEAAHARPHYRRVVVDNLESCDLGATFAGQRYDFIVCADVLEHLSRPERVLGACRALLAPGGRLLISVPNASYCGLVLDLMHGEFRYREEGLLDSTHLRFFTRRSLTRLLHAQHWGLEVLDTVQREWPESEFQVELDSVPPAVARYLLAQPDALAYQFIVMACPAEPDAAAAMPFSVIASPTSAAHAIFTAQLYLAAEGAYSEDSKLLATGIMGSAHQTLRFPLPAFQAARPGLRLDPADRPGFLHLHAITLTDAQGRICWHWNARTQPVALLEGQAHQQMVWTSPLPSAPDALLLLLTGDDPWFELPIGPETLAQCLQLPGAVLDVQLGWPMSADYLALSSSVSHLQAQIASMEPALAQLQQERIEAGAALHAAALHIQTLEPAHQAWEHLQQEHQHLQALYQQLQDHLQGIENSTIFRATRPIVRAKMRWDQLRRPAAASAPKPEPELEVTKKARTETEEEMQAAIQPPEPVSFETETAPANLALQESTAPGAAEPAAALLAVQPGEPASAVTAAAAAAVPASMVDIIVPVYRGLNETRLCLESVLASTCSTPWRLVVINDASPEPELHAWLRDQALRDARITLLENATNLGFVGTVNRGMALAEGHDVLLLNSDTEVASDWLDRLRAAAYSAPDVATATPFSNNATICSYPRFCSDNPLPSGFDTARMDALCAQTNAGAVLDIPTGVGFCMYIRRDCLAQVGLFDMESFGKGYGEENDFCQRAAQSGWRNLHALDTFVRHTGGTSFGDSKNAREQAAQATLQRLHPGYEAEVRDFVARDPARPYRYSLDLARINASQLPRILAVLHNANGGTRRHVEELTSYLIGKALVFSLIPLPDHVMRLQWEAPNEALNQLFHWPTQSGQLIATLREIGIVHVHYHHLLGIDPQVMLLAERLGVTYDFTAHDYYTACPQIALVDMQHNYCGEQGIAQCTTCLAQRPAPTGETIEDWRLRHQLFLRNARYLLAPSHDVAQRIRRYFPNANLSFVSHLDIAADAVLAQPRPRRLSTDAHLRILVIGAVNEVKGANMLESVALRAASLSAPLEFHLVGYAHRPLKTQPHASLTVHGAYADSDMPRLLERLQPDIVWFPARWPETYSYTLSACLLAGVPVMAPDLGAFPERLSQRHWTWIKPWNTSAPAWVDIFQDLRSQYFITGQAPPLAPRFIPISTDAYISFRTWSYATDYLQGLETADASSAP